MSAVSVKEIIGDKILLIRGHRVMVDRDLAKLYGVSTSRLNEQVKRNKKRFPSDFMFQMTWEEIERFRPPMTGSREASSRSQIAILKKGKNIKYRPYVFTEQGVAMLSSVLKSERAVLVNVAIMRAFVKLRETLSLHKELAMKLRELERKVAGHDEAIHAVFQTIRRLMREEEKPKQRIGFHP